MTATPDPDRLAEAVDAFRRMPVPETPAVLLPAPRPDRRWKCACAALAVVQCLTLTGWAIDTRVGPDRSTLRLPTWTPATEQPPAPSTDIPRVSPPVALLDDPDRLPQPAHEAGHLAAVTTAASSFRAVGLD